MRSKLILMLLFGGIAPVCAVRSQDADSLRKEKNLSDRQGGGHGNPA